MPCFRGLDISIGTNSGPLRLPEFPHPDSCSVTLLDPEPSASVLEPTDNSKLPLPKGTNIFGNKRAGPRISVYVPSLPGMRFWVQYSVLRAPSNVSHLYFKMFANGNNVANWGINLKKRTAGAVTRALCKPDPEWCCRNEAGQPTHSIEARSFGFPPQQGLMEVTRDEDIIEIQVFRASGRRRKVPKVHSSCPEGVYGRCLLAACCLEMPEKAAYFDWHLLDRRDSAYATFRFYCQSWDTLSRLNIISPPSDTSLIGWEGLLAGSTSTSDPSVTPVSSFTQDPKWATGCGHGDTCRSCSVGIDPRWTADTIQTQAASRAVIRPPELLESRTGSPRKPQPSKQMRDGFLDGNYHRPLPALPIQRRRAATICDRPEHSSNSSYVGEVHKPSAACTSQTIKEESPVHIGKQTHPSSSYTTTRFKHPALARSEPPAAGTIVSMARNRKQKAVRGLFSSSQKQREFVTAPAGSTAGREAARLSQLPGMECPRVAESDAGERAEQGTRTKQAHLTDGKVGLLSLPRGLLGPDLTRIPLKGPSGDLMKRLRSEDPFK